MLKNITIKNLRCFEDFTLNGMTQLTLISGRNNVGKTTILEAIFLLFAYQLPDIFLKVSAIRGNNNLISFPQGTAVGLDPLVLWETLFTNMDMDLTVHLSMDSTNNTSYTLKLKKDNSATQSQIIKTQSGHDFQSTPGSYPLAIEFSHNKIADKGTHTITPQGLSVQMSKNVHIKSIPFTIYRGPNASILYRLAADWIGKIELESFDNKKLIIDALRILNNDIDDIFTVSRNGIVDLYAKWDTSKPRPMFTLGDGINKLLNYLLAMIANPGGIFLLDEIETGFHYSFYPKLWEILARVAEKTNSQIIATTHSYECIVAAFEGVKRVDLSLLTCARLEKEKTSVVPHLFSGCDLEFAIKNEMELR